MQIQGDQLKLKNAAEQVRQLRKVLRATPGYHFFVQNTEARFSLELIKWTDTEIFAKIREKILIPQEMVASAMAIAYPNKQEKLELIIQKLTEIGMSKIYLRPAERSVLKELSPQKLDRLKKIQQEATEQSRWWRIPEIVMISSLSEIRDQYQMLVFDIQKEEQQLEKSLASQAICGVIGPEWGLTERDYQTFDSTYQTKSLGEQILRMETAAIIGWWLIKQSY